MGVQIGKDRVNFSIAVPADKDCQLLLYRTGRKKPCRQFDMKPMIGEVRCIALEDIQPGDYEYNYLINKEVVTDPYVKAIAGKERWGVKKELSEHEIRGRLQMSDYDWEGDHTLQIPYHQVIAYSLHIRGFTRHPSSKVKAKGTFQGVIEKLEYLKKHRLVLSERFLTAAAESLEYAEREDFRNVTTFTIDPKDAKDFDDALSIRLIKPGLWEVGVHIADVTHYVKEGGVTDKQAEKRATSVYLVDRTIPMLPERLCNFICSLRPDEEKLAYSVIFEMTEKGEVKNSRVVHTVIKSDRRFTYEEAQEIIETGKGDFQEEVLQLDKLAKILRENRFKAGAINFDPYEVKFEIDEKGKPVSVYFKESKDANKLIEEFMLLANCTVAEKIGRVPKGKKAKVLPYRIHDLPDPEKLDNLAQFIARFGYKLRTSGTKTDISKSINHLLDDIQGKKEENLIETVSIRAMQKARYSVHNVGHYGLAFDYYTHFTSPIRRYPDMMVHRLLTKYLDQGGRTVSEQKYEALCEHSSSMEQIASNAERASIKYKQVEFMTERLGQTFDGVISGVTEWGLYVELNENKCEGMIPIRDLDDDYYEFDEKNYCLRGRRKNKIYSLGDAITIKVARANLEKKQLDFALV